MLTAGEAAARHLEQLPRRRAPTDRDRSYCLHALTRHLAVVDPAAARAALERAFALARQPDPWSLTYCWRERMRLAWVDGRRSRPRRRARGLDVIEALREVQRSEPAEAPSSSRPGPRTITGSRAGSSKRERPDTSPRLRGDRAHAGARLFDALSAAGSRARRDPALAERRAAVLEEIARVQRRLLEPGLPAAERTRPAGLQRLELDEAELRDRSPSEPARRPRRPDFASLARVRRALAADEALLSFQIAPWQDAAGDFAGGSWLLAVTRGGARAYRLPGPRRAAAGGRRSSTGSSQRRDGSEAAAAARRSTASSWRRPSRELPAGRPAARHRPGRRPPPASRSPPCAPSRGRRRSPPATRSPSSPRPRSGCTGGASRPPRRARARPWRSPTRRRPASGRDARRGAAPAERAAVFAAMRPTAAAPLRPPRGAGRGAASRRRERAAVGEEASEDS